MFLEMEQRSVLMIARVDLLQLQLISVKSSVKWAGRAFNLYLKTNIAFSNLTRLTSLRMPSFE